ncbi:TetR/AcrR family transcriptional regulator, partial [Corynebacterium durum]
MRKDARENREEILRVARLLFAQHGLEVSMRTIASTVGVGIATLYRNFPTRADLILGLVE